MPPTGAFQSLKNIVQNQQGLQNLLKKKFEKNSQNQINLLLFGAPGVGKGTFGTMIQKEFDFKAFSTGDYFRHIVKVSKESQNSAQELDPFTLQISEIINSGKLVDDTIVVDIVRNLKQNSKNFMGGIYDNTAGLILDGVPRTLKQAEMINKFMDIDLVLNFYNRDDILMQKIIGRRVCPCCGKNFNVADVNSDGYVMAPLLPKGPDPTICDDISHSSPVKLIQRDDDREDIVLERLEIYKQKTLPIIDYYKSQSNTVIVDFEVKKGKKDYPQISQYLKEALQIDQQQAVDNLLFNQS